MQHIYRTPRVLCRRLCTLGAFLQILLATNNGRRGAPNAGYQADGATLLPWGAGTRVTQQCPQSEQLGGRSTNAGAGTGLFTLRRRRSIQKKHVATRRQLVFFAGRERKQAGRTDAGVRTVSKGVDWSSACGKCFHEKESGGVGALCARVPHVLVANIMFLPPSSCLPLSHHRHSVGDGTSPSYATAYEGCPDETIGDAESCAKERERERCRE